METIIKNEKVIALKQKIEELEKTLFYINLIDHWTKEDYATKKEYENQLKELKDLLIEEIVEN